MTEPTPERVRAAEERREFRQLLDDSSIGQLPPALAAQPHVGSGLCQTCANDRCGQFYCVSADCACTCMADRAALADELLEIFGQHPENLTAVADELYTRGWRRQ